jgi:uncharacterized DUF497 family protein
MRARLLAAVASVYSGDFSTSIATSGGSAVRLDVNFEWDPGKARRNRRKHRVSFQEAATVFGDPLAVTYLDPDHSISEQRFITIGMSTAGRVLSVAHSDRDDNMRIVSARKTTLRERKQYEEKN